jgi:hypothetical protein
LGVAARENMLRSIELVIFIEVLYGELMRVSSIILPPLLIDDEIC